MKNVAYGLLGLVLSASLAAGAQVNVRVEACLNPAVGCDHSNPAHWGTKASADHGAEVPYRVTAWVTPADVANNQGLALFGYDLAFDCDGVRQALERVNPPSETVTPGIEEFIMPQGISNPERDNGQGGMTGGFGGTQTVPGLEGVLVQVGAAWNTINNTEINAQYPIGGAPTLPFAHSNTVLAIGTLTIPHSAIDECHVVLSNIFANTVSPTATETDPFWAVEAATPDPDPENLTINTAVVCPAFMSSTPPCSEFPLGVGDTPLPHTRGNCVEIHFAGPIVAPIPGSEIEVRELLAGGGFGADVTANFDFTVEGTDTLRVRNRITSPTTPPQLANQTWYGVRGIGGCFNFDLHFPVLYGDVNASRSVNAIDLNVIWAGRGAAAPCTLIDINGDGAVNAIDLNIAWANRNLTLPEKPSGHDCDPAPQ